MYAYIGNKHFFTKSCHCQTYQNSKISWQKMCSILPFRNWSYQKMPITRYVLLNWYSSMKKSRKIRIIFDIENHFEGQKLAFLSAGFGLLVGFTMTWFSEEILISNICIRGFMCSVIKKSWTVSSEDLRPALTVNFLYHHSFSPR